MKGLTTLMKLLVFGKTGQVARELAALAAPDVVVEALGRQQAELTDPETCALLVERSDADAVINVAAFTDVDGAEEQEELARVINGEAPTAMARAAAARGLPFLHVSSDYVFDGSGNAPHSPGDPVAPLNAYGRSKLAGEVGIRAAGGRAAILRTSWVFSAHGKNFVKTMLRLSDTRNALNVVADQVGGPTPAADIARTLVTMAGAMVAGQGGGTYHYAGAPAISWAGFAREVFRQAGREVEVADMLSRDYPVAAERPLNSRLDCTTLEAGFGIAPADWKVGLSRVIRELETG